MRFWPGWFLACVFCASALAETPPCFDFSKVSTRLLRDQVAYAPGTNTAFGPLPDRGGWGAARARVKLPPKRVLELLRDQTTLKNPKECDLQVTREARPGYLDFQIVELAISPLPLITIRWQEQWGYVLLMGTEEQPLQAVISYQKTAGTSHIKRFCGNIVLTAVGAESPNETDVSFYEEADATRRSPEDIMKGHLGTLQTLIGVRPPVRQ